MRQAQKAYWQNEVAKQRKWIAEHGGNLAGYVARYGSKDDAQHFGDGGELIYAADIAHLRELEDVVAGKEKS